MEINNIERLLSKCTSKYFVKMFKWVVIIFSVNNCLSECTVVFVMWLNTVARLYAVYQHQLPFMFLLVIPCVLHSWKLKSISSFSPLVFSVSFCLSSHSLHSLSTVWSMMSFLPIERSTTRDKAKTLWTETKSLYQTLSYQAISAPRGKDVQFIATGRFLKLLFSYGYKNYLSQLKSVHF